MKLILLKLFAILIVAYCFVWLPLQALELTIQRVMQ